MIAKINELFRALRGSEFKELLDEHERGLSMMREAFELNCLELVDI